MNLISHTVFKLYGIEKHTNILKKFFVTRKIKKFFFTETDENRVIFFVTKKAHTHTHTHTHILTF